MPSVDDAIAEMVATLDGAADRAEVVRGIALQNATHRPDVAMVQATVYLGDVVTAAAGTLSAVLGLAIAATSAQPAS